MCPSITLEEAHSVIPWKEKKDFYSAAAKVACRVGGPSPEGSTDVERKPETMELAITTGIAQPSGNRCWTAAPSSG